MMFKTKGIFRQDLNSGKAGTEMESFFLTQTTKADTLNGLYKGKFTSRTQ